MNTTIQIRIDKTTKAKAQKAFKREGLDLSSGIKYLLNEKINNPGTVSHVCPFGYVHRYTAEMLKRFQKEEREVLKRRPRFSSVKEMFDDLEK